MGITKDIMRGMLSIYDTRAAPTKPEQRVWKVFGLHLPWRVKASALALSDCFLNYSNLTVSGLSATLGLDLLQTEGHVIRSP